MVLVFFRTRIPDFCNGETAIRGRCERVRRRTPLTAGPDQVTPDDRARQIVRGGPVETLYERSCQVLRTRSRRSRRRFAAVLCLPQLVFQSPRSPPLHSPIDGSRENAEQNRATMSQRAIALNHAPIGQCGFGLNVLFQSAMKPATSFVTSLFFLITRPRTQSAAIS